MSGHDLALLTHLVGVVFLFSGVSIACELHAAARRQERPSQVALLLGVARAGVLFVGAGGVLVLAGGFWLIGESDGFYSLGDRWIVAGLLLLLVAFVAGWLGGQQPKRTRVLAEQLAREGDAPSAELRTLLDDARASALNYGAAGAIFLAFVLMIWKP